MTIILRSVLVLLAVYSFDILAISGHAKSITSEIPYLRAEVKIDGNLDEAEWGSALEISLDYEVSPGENTRAPVITHALLFEDGENLYIGFTALDHDPGSIRANLTDRDTVDNADQIYIKLDTFNDSRSAFQFSVNPLGIQSDSILDERTSSHDRNWDAIWYSSGKITSEGYQVEIQIPFKALRFTTHAKDQIWGFEVGRVWPRDVVRRLSNIRLNRNNACQICQFAKINGFSRASAPTNLTIIPGLTLLESDSRLSGAGQLWQNGDIEDRWSLDLRWGIAQNHYLNATVNPDFSQVEADALQLDINNLSSLFLTEKRAFFQDGAEFFKHWSRLVYTRIFEEPKAGIKLTGKEERHSYGLMSVKDKHTNLLLPYEYGTRLLRLEDTESDNFVFRYRYDLGDRGNIGATVTHRQAEGYQSSSLGLDGTYWFSESDSFKYQFLTSETDYPDRVLAIRPDQQSSLAGDAYSLNYQHQSRNWDWQLTYHRFEEDFRADTGYISFGNWKRAALNVSRIWHAELADSWWKKFEIEVLARKTEEIDNTPIDQGNEVYISLDAIYESQLGYGIINSDQHFINPTLPQSVNTEFDRDSQLVWVVVSPSSRVDLDVEYAWGDEIEYSTNQPANVKTLTTQVDVQLSEQFSSVLEYINESLDLVGEPVYQVDLTNFLIAYQINEKSFIRLTLQNRRLSDLPALADEKLLATQLIYSYKVNPFTLFYLGYSDKFVTDINSLSLAKTDKTLFMKFSYAWQL